MTKKLLSITAVFVFAISATAIAQVKIGYMNTQQVLSNLPERERVQNELDSFIKKKQKELSDRATAYQDAVAEYQKNRESMSESEIKKHEQKLSEMQSSLDEFNQKIRQEVQQKREELLAPVFERINNAISTVAENKELDFVLNKTTSTGSNILFYASNNQPDITQSVLNELTSNSQN